MSVGGWGASGDRVAKVKVSQLVSALNSRQTVLKMTPSAAAGGNGSVTDRRETEKRQVNR
jgi:hypothetical protein